MNQIRIFSLLAVLVSSLSAFAATNDSPADADAWFDITVLSARVRPDLTLKNFDQVENCKKTYDQRFERRGITSHLETFDCTEHVERSLGAKAFKKLPAWEFVDGRLQTAMDTPLVEVFTIIPEDRLARADYVGFSESFLGGRVNLFKAIGIDGETREVGKVQLKDGRYGVVHRWIAAFEQTGNVNGGVIRSLPFKPVLVRREAGNDLRYWDRMVGQGMFKDYVISNYRVEPNGRYVLQQPNAYDRSNDLLKR